VARWHRRTMRGGVVTQRDEAVSRLPDAISRHDQAVREILGTNTMHDRADSRMHPANTMHEGAFAQMPQSVTTYREAVSRISEAVRQYDEPVTPIRDAFARRHVPFTHILASVRSTHGTFTSRSKRHAVRRRVRGDTSHCRHSSTDDIMSRSTIQQVRAVRPRDSLGRPRARRFCHVVGSLGFPSCRRAAGYEDSHPSLPRWSNKVGRSALPLERLAVTRRWLTD
jgi:hypothetical protein